MILALLLVTATFQPAQPRVGDLITVTFPAPVVLDASRDYEVVSARANQVVIRTFEPRPFTMSGKVGGAPFNDVIVPVGSVLRQGDDLAPAPLAPPLKILHPRTPFVAMAIAAVVMALAWLAAWLRSRKPVVEIAPQLTPEERFRAAVLTLRANPGYKFRWAALANETRAFLIATRPNLGGDLTTTELLPRLREEQGIVEEILRQGDLEKFSGRGAAPRDFDEVVERALELAS